jgi:hypothetical protein
MRAAAIASDHALPGILSSIDDSNGMEDPLEALCSQNAKCAIQFQQKPQRCHYFER